LRLRGDLLPARLLSPSFQSHNPLSAAFALAYDEIRDDPELRTPRQLDQPTRATPRAGRFLTRKEERPERRYPRLPSASLLCTPSREGEAAEVMPFGRARQNIRDDAAIAKSDRRCSPISARNGSANSLSFCCPTPASCANSLLLCGHACAIWRSVASEKIIQAATSRSAAIFRRSARKRSKSFSSHSISPARGVRTFFAGDSIGLVNVIGVRFRSAIIPASVTLKVANFPGAASNKPRRNSSRPILCHCSRFKSAPIPKVDS